VDGGGYAERTVIVKVIPRGGEKEEATPLKGHKALERAR